MCDFSLHQVKSPPARLGDKLRTVNFNTGTRGFAAPEDSTTAVCILPGTELAFSEEVKCAPVPFGFSGWRTKTVNFKTAIFRQINKAVPRVHHDALEFPDGTSVLLTDLHEGQEPTVLQLPAQPKSQPRKQLRGASATWADIRRSSRTKPGPSAPLAALLLPLFGQQLENPRRRGPRWRQPGLARDFERYATTVAAFIRLAMIRIMLRRLAANASS